MKNRPLTRLSFLLSIPFIMATSGAWLCADPPGTQPTSAPRSLRLMTWNIAGCALGLDGLLAELRRQDADVICLQEAEAWTHRLAGADQAEVIAQKLGFHHVAAGSSFTSGGEQREAILSRWPLGPSQPLDAGTGRIYGISTTIDRPGRPLRVVSIHLTCTFKPDARHILQTTKARLSEAADLEQRLAKWNEPIVLAGDFNAVLGTSEHERIARRLNRAPATQPTFPAGRPALAVDHVYHSAGFRLQRVEVIESTASDHRPMVVELQYP